VNNTSGQELTKDEIEAFNMWINKQHGILPNQYHYFYEQGDTLIYPEHVADLITIDKMYQNRLKKEHQREEAKRAVKHNNPLKSNSSLGNQQQQPGANFYGTKFVYQND
jgi:hypothetical protein